MGQLSLDLLPDAGLAAPVMPDLASYDRVLVGFSGGKDSLACVLHLLEQGVPRERIELHHHDIDGRGETYMDWVCTPAYCEAVADALGIPLYYSWRQGGFLAEMLKENARSRPVEFEVPEGGTRTAGGVKGKIETRLRHPQPSPNLLRRWCGRIWWPRRSRQSGPCRSASIRPRGCCRPVHSGKTSPARPEYRF